MAENLQRQPAAGGLRHSSQEIANTSVDTDANGDFTVDMSGLKRIESKADVNAKAEGGFLAHVQSISGVTVTIRVFNFDYDAAADGAAIANTSATDITAVNVNARGY